MSPLFYVLFVAFALIALLLVAFLWALNRIGRAVPWSTRGTRSTRQQRRHWMRERLDINPALRRRA